MNRVFVYNWNVTDNNTDNLNELNSLLAGDYHVGAVFDMTDNSFEKGRFVFILHKNVDIPEAVLDDDDDGDEWKKSLNDDKDDAE